MVWTAWLLIWLFVLSAPLRIAMACPSVSFFAEPCEDEASETPQAPPPPMAPLFTKDTVARDTPPVLLQMLQEPAARTPQHARRFVAQEQEKQRILLEVQRLIQDATPPRPPR